MKLFLIDGHALIFKMYYAFIGRPMVNSKGVDTSILFGFTKYLLELISRENPSHIAVSFDPPGGTFRNKLYPAYKANRGETPQPVIDALEPLTRIVEALNIPVLMMSGFEADDVIGSAAKRFAAEGFDVYMVTPDKDYGQLIEPHIFQYKPGKGGGENELLGVEEICRKWNISSPSQVIDLLAICGDASDNVPGVQGVGPVGAAKLLAKYGSVDGIYSHIDELSARQKQLFEAARDHIGLSRELVTIKTDLALPVSAEDMALSAVKLAEITALLELYEMNSLKRHLSKFPQGEEINCAPAPIKPEVKAKAEVSMKSANASEFCSLVASAKDAAVSITEVGKAEKLTLCIAETVSSGSPEEFRSVLEDASVTKVGSDLKSLANALSLKGFELAGKYKDVELMHYLLNPERSHKTDSLAKSYLGIDLDDSDTSGVSEGPLSLFDDFGEALPVEKDKSLETFVLLRLSESLDAEFDTLPNLRKLYDEIEEPLIHVLSRMELAGVRIDLSSLREFADSLRKEMLSHEAEVRRIADMPNLNVSSPKQIGEVIFEKLKLDPKAKKAARGSWPTDEQTLAELADRSPIIGEILEYRGTRKLLSTYIEPFPAYVSPLDGRVHTTFNQALTATGRLSSSNPNLQNIPIRTDQGREIRKAFVAEGEDMVMMSADYSQIELRIMAHLCSDEHLCAAFREGVDVHAATAAKIFKCSVAEVSTEQRRIAKTANFGIMYGISSFGLSQRLGCSRAEAKRIIEDYFSSFPNIRDFIDTTLEFARTNGYVETIFGRRRYLPDVNSRNGNVRSIAERNAVNAPIQGSSADIIKLAMNGVDRRLREEGLRTRMVLQIHDELLLEVPLAEIDRAREIVVSEMEGVISLNVPLTVECDYGKTWLEAH